MHCSFDADFCFRTRLRRPSHDQRRAVLDVVKALAALDPAGFGLDDACAQLEGSTYVMAEEARRYSATNRLTTYVDGAIVKFPSTVAIHAASFASTDAEHMNRRPQVTVRSFLSTHSLVDQSRDGTSANHAIDTDLALWPKVTAPDPSP